MAIKVGELSDNAVVIDLGRKPTSRDISALHRMCLAVSKYSRIDVDGNAVTVTVDLSEKQLTSKSTLADVIAKIADIESKSLDQISAETKEKIEKDIADINAEVFAEILGKR